MGIRSLVLLVLAIWLLLIVFVLDNQRRLQNSVPKPTPTATEVPKEDFLIMLGDTGTGLKSQYDVARQIENLCKTENCEAGFIAGDVIYTEGAKTSDDAQFQLKVEQPYANLKFPIYLAFGNHDALGCKNCYLEYAKKSEKLEMPGNYYVIELDDTKLFVIDTEPFDLDQRQKLAADLAVQTNKFKVVVGHRPFNTDEVEHHGENWQGRDLLLETICNQADLYVAGHAHLLEDAGKVNNCKFEQFISGGGGADPRQTVEDLKSTYVHSGNGFLAIKSTPKQLELKFYSDKGEMLYTKAITK